MEWLGRAWRGDIELWQAIWLIAVPIFVLGCWLTAAPAYLFTESFIREHTLLSFWLISGFKILVCSFAVICVWRAASLEDLDDSSFRPPTARIGIIIYALVMIAPSAAFLYLATKQYVKDPAGFKQNMKQALTTE